MNGKTDSKGLSLATTAMDGGSAGFAGAKTGRFLFSDRLLETVKLLTVLVMHVESCMKDGNEIELFK